MGVPVNSGDSPQSRTPTSAAVKPRYAAVKVMKSIKAAAAAALRLLRSAQCTTS
jgi:hypothetical protein